MKAVKQAKGVCFLLFVVPFCDVIDKRFSNYKGMFGSLEEAIGAPKKLLPANNSQKAEIHSATVGLRRDGLNRHTVAAGLWWDEEGKDWKIIRCDS